MWHIAAEYKVLKDIPEYLFTEEILSVKNAFGDTTDTVLHVAAKYGSLNQVPSHLLTEKALNQINHAFNNKSFETVWHIAAEYGTLKDIPKEHFSINSLNEKDKYGSMVWHLAAQHDGLKDIPARILTSAALGNSEEERETVWESAIRHNTLKDIPKHLITKDLLEMKESQAKVQDFILQPKEYLFLKKDRSYVNKVISDRLNKAYNLFIKDNPSLAKDIEFTRNRNHDSVKNAERLVLIDANEKSLSFKFQDRNAKILLNKKGVYMNKKAYKTLGELVRFIDNDENIEQRLTLPEKHVVTVGEFEL